MIDNFTQLWFDWFYKNWERYAPGELLESGLESSQVAERFVDDYQEYLLEFSKKFDNNNYEALNEFMKLSEAELHILKYFLKLVKLRKSK